MYRVVWGVLGDLFVTCARWDFVFTGREQVARARVSVLGFCRQPCVVRCLQVKPCGSRYRAVSVKSSAENPVLV